VEHDLGRHARHRGGDRLGVAHVELDQLRAVREGVGEVLPAAGREVVDDRHVVASGEERVDQVRPDESGAAGDESLHTAAEVSSRSGPGCALLRSPRMRGLFVTFEGIDRSGKTTQARLLTEALGDEALGVREPGGTPAGERVRDLLKDAAVPLGAEAEALLFAAARAELVERVIRPALDEGRVVISDRFLDSSLAYQGGARGLGVDEVARVNRFATGGLAPDLTFLLEIDPAAAARRAGESDRFEDEGAALQQAVLEAYERLVAADPGRWRRIDATRAPEQVHADVLAEVEAARSGVGA
jgi:dTMP kinase